MRLVMGAAGSFAAISTIFGNPVIGAVIIIEAAGLGRPTLPLVLLPGLVAAGIGSLVFLGLGALSGLSPAAYALAPLNLPPTPELTVVDFVLAIVLAVGAAIVCPYCSKSPGSSSDSWPGGRSCSCPSSASRSPSSPGSSCS